MFDISEGDDEMTVIDELMEWYLGEDVDRVRMVNDPRYEREWYEPVEVCLDSGADCRVLPLSFYSEELGTTELPELRMMITDAQGNAIRTTETRANITFEFQKENGRTLKVIDSCVFGEVTQPLFAVGKLWKTGWGMEPYSHEKAFLVKGNSRIPISFHRNSTMTEVRIYRAEARSVQEENVKRTVKRVEIREGLKECLDREKWTDGWFFLPDGRPARFDWSTRTTYDPTEDSMEFPYRTVFYGPCSGDEILWSEMEMFSRAEEWQGFEVMEFEKVEDVVITIMERTPQEVSRYIYERQREQEKKSQEEASSSSDAKKDKVEIDAQEKLEKRLPAIGEDEFEEEMIVGGVELTPESSLKELKQACKLLGVGVTGSKKLLWQRLKKEVAENKLKTMVDISKSIQKEFVRDPSGPKPVYEPTPEERALYQNKFMMGLLWSTLRVQGDDASRDACCSGALLGRIVAFCNKLVHLNRPTRLMAHTEWTSLLTDWRRPLQQHDIAEFATHIFQKLRMPAFQGTWHARALDGEVRDIGDTNSPIVMQVDGCTTLQSCISCWSGQPLCHALTAAPSILCVQLERFTYTGRRLTKNFHAIIPGAAMIPCVFWAWH